MPIEHISFTQLNMFLRCGEQYRRRYIDGKIIPPSGSLVRGKCCHHAISVNMTQKIKSKQDLALEQIKDAFADEWESTKYQIAWNEDELDGQSPKKVEGQYKDAGIALTEIFHIEQCPNCQPIKVEDEFLIKFEGGYLPLLGYIDRIDADDILAEQKFVSKSPPKNEIENAVQVTAYDLGFRAKYGKKPTWLWMQWAIATKQPKTVLQSCRPREDDVINRFLFRLEAFMSALERGVFLPASNDAWVCSPKWCGYYQSCKFRK